MLAGPLHPNLWAVLVCTFAGPALAKADENTPEGRYGTYKLTDMTGYQKAHGLPFCEANAEKILDKWRGTLTIKYSKGTILVNDEPWIFDGDYSITNVVGHRPPDPKIKGRIDVGFLRVRKRGLATLFYFDEGRTCSTVVAFTGKWTEP